MKTCVLNNDKDNCIKIDLVRETFSDIMGNNTLVRNLTCSTYLCDQTQLDEYMNKVEKLIEMYQNNLEKITIFSDDVILLDTNNYSVIDSVEIIYEQTDNKALGAEGTIRFLAKKK